MHVHKPPPKALPQKGKRKPDALPRKCKRKVDALLQGSPNKGKRRHEHRAPRQSWHKLDALSHVDWTKV
jgi:hypothetical protein